MGWFYAKKIGIARRTQKAVARVMLEGMMIPSNPPTQRDKPGDAHTIGRVLLLGIAICLLLLGPFGQPAFATEITVYRSPSCGCCGKWIEHLEQEGFVVTDELIPSVAPVKSRLGVPRHLESCHTAEVEGYVIEGHVPAEDIRRLLVERPKATGLAVPGMPVGSPGKEMGDRNDAYDVVLFGGGEPSIFASH